MGMWVQLSENNVIDLETNNGFSVKANDDAQQRRTWSVVRYKGNANPPSIVLQAGYATDVEARNAMTELLSGWGIEPVRIQPPVTNEETNEEEAS